MCRRIGQRSQRARLPVPEGGSVGSIWAVLAFSGLASLAYLRASTCAYLLVIAASGPDVLVTDLNPVTPPAGQITGLPAAMTYASVMERGRGSQPWRAIRRAAKHRAARARAGSPLTRTGCTSAPVWQRSSPRSPAGKRWPSPARCHLHRAADHRLVPQHARAGE